MTERLAIHQLRCELERLERYWNDWNGRAANTVARLEGENKDLQKRIEELEAQLRWRSVKDELPTEEGLYLVTLYDTLGDTVGPGTYVTTSWWSTEHDWDEDMSYKPYGFTRVTHWMPLPEPPEEQNK